MNNIVNMVNYYILHKNADDSIIDYLKNKIEKSSIEELIIIQIELLYTDPADKLVSELVNYINSKINDILLNIKIDELINLISILKDKIDFLNKEINELSEENKKTFEIIKTKDLNKDDIFDDKDSKIASNLIEKTKTNDFIINKNKSEIRSINIWLNNLENSLNKKINKGSISDLINNYINILIQINKNSFINDYINLISSKIESQLLNNNLLDTISNIIPELNRIYNDNYKSNNKLSKLLDYYIDLVDDNIKSRIYKLDYNEKLVLKDKINAICFEILHNDTKSDDFKVLIIRNYLRYL